MRSNFYLLALVCLSSCATIPDNDSAKESVVQLDPKKRTLKIDTTSEFGLAAPSANYPQEALRGKLEGSCVVIFKIKTTGETTEHKVVECTPEGYFENAALDAAQYIRATRPPEVVEVSSELTFQWVLAK